MLTRLRVSGFKNLFNVDVAFGPFTCIAGANGVGKSNLFDAIRFLSLLADSTLIDAARTVRDDSGKNWDIKSLFQQVGDECFKEMTLEADMIIPVSGRDDITQSEVKATSTFLRYKLVLTYEAGKEGIRTHPLRIVHESLVPIPRGQASKLLRFRPSKEWLNSILTGVGKRTVEYISTPDGKSIIHLHQDKQASSSGGGRSFQLPAAQQNRTVLSLTNSGETPTALLAKREMQSWRLLQLEPSALRQQDPLLAPPRLGANGSRLPATLFRLAHGANGANEDGKIYSRVANRLHELLGEIKQVRVDFDERRDLLTLVVIDGNGTIIPAQSLSDGTLRFLALSVLAEDPESIGVICFEEPENGIHPQRIPAILSLLQDIACDTNFAVGEQNPLRQVIINTHSPGVVAGVGEEDLILARTQNGVRKGIRFEHVVFDCLEKTWRAHDGATTATIGALMSYLLPPGTETAFRRNSADGLANGNKSKTPRRVAERPEFKNIFDFEPTQE